MFFRGCVECGWYERVSSPAEMMTQRHCLDCGAITAGGMSAEQFEACRKDYDPDEEEDGE